MKSSLSTTIFMASIAGLAGLLFGYDAGIISGAMLFIKGVFHLNDVWQGAVVSAVPFGALVFALFGGKLNDMFGRKIALLFTAFMFGLGTLFCAFAGSTETLIIGRLLLGFAIGIGSFSAPLYIAEISPEKYRGALVTINQLAIVSGILLSYLVDYWFAPTAAWRWMLGLSFIPAVMLFLGAIKLPQSPRWLMTKQRVSDAQKVLDRIHGPEKAKLEMADIKTVLTEEKLTLRQSLSDSYLRIILLGVFVSILTQAVGINAIIYYAPTIFESTGFSHGAHTLLATVSIGLVNFIFTILAIYLLDRVGRRKLLITGICGIVLSLVVLTVGFAYGIQKGPLSYIILISMMLFVACQGFSTGPACWLIPSEIFPLKIRGVGMGIAVAFNWGTNVIVGFLFPIVLHRWGATASFGIFLVIAVIAALYFYFQVPETKNMSLERIEENLLQNKPLRELGSI